MKTRPSLALAVTALVIAVATACTPGATPTTTPTPTFSTEAEAFAAAEATYRAYVDAVNRRWADSSSEPDPQTFLIGRALEDDLTSQRRFDELGIHIEGETRLLSIDLLSAADGMDQLLTIVCVDSSGTRVIDDAGSDVTPADRPNPPLEIGFTLVSGQFLISESDVSERTSC